MPGPTGRSEKRTARAEAVELSCLDDSLLKERAFTENVSPLGARVVTGRECQPGTRVLVIFPKDGVRSRAEVVYCARLAESRFAVGLELSTRVEQWAKPR
jgi:hypothetical protein